MQLHDDRVFAWSEWGPVDSLPVLFGTGAGMSRSIGFGASDLPDLGGKPTHQKLITHRS